MRGCMHAICKCVPLGIITFLAIYIVLIYCLVTPPRRRVDREIRIHSRLSHPNIVKLHTWFEDERGIYLVLELLPRDLFRCASEGANMKKCLT